MTPLYLLPRPASRRRLASPFWSLVALSTALLLGLLAPGDVVLAQETARSGDDLKARPVVPAETQRMRRTPKIDGVMEEGEWDVFYTILDGPIPGTVYCHWDENYLYLAARTEQAALLVCAVDAGGDGWLRGADNLEVVVGNVGELSGLDLAARLLDARSPDAPAWREGFLETRTIRAAGTVTGGRQFVELAIPKDMGSLVLRDGASLGLRVAFLRAGAAADYTPSPAYEPRGLLTCRLVESKVEGAPGINPKLTLSDYKCVAGQSLQATLELLNQTDAPVGVRSLSWGGALGATNAVNTLREVNVPPVPAMKRQRYTYKTTLPSSLVPGAYTLTVSAELEGGKQAQAQASFVVVEPLQVQVCGDPQPVAVVGLTKLDFLVDIYSAVPGTARGQVELTKLPSGWMPEGGPRRGFEIEGQDRSKIVRYTFKLPSTTPAGDYPIEAVVSYRGQEWRLSTVLRVVRLETATPAP